MGKIYNLTGHDVNVLGSDDESIANIVSDGLIRLDIQEVQVASLGNIPVMERHPKLSDEAIKVLSELPEGASVIISAQMVQHVQSERADLTVYTVGKAVFGENHSVKGVKYLVRN
ncbi:hypothetical protein [Ligilactobacillus equi]|uniref:Uncharacterized protein n=1 Tax=Ligilactobacillus equi DSM 15833 = JCM 10991 TaxID=1423740 RepID=A0A0R1TSJ0_9LACO|nr:hypothetical protein [Ligilactobacillus equi]KRL84327.1 hypothetical protein FC36_GL000250 [Ligilactobacillus equi DSM 15833 = JCM 10991]